jgi:hypothetical protein
MRSTGLALAGALTLSQGIALAQGSWGAVKSWTGTVTIEATDNRKGEGGSSTMTYKATGDFTISDDMMPDGSHMQWPMPSVEAMSDPKQRETVYDRWQAHVVASYESNGKNEAGQSVSVKCAADNRKASRLGLTINPTEPTYVLQVSAPEALFKCTDPSFGAPNGGLQQESFSLTGPRKAPGPVSGSQTFTVGTSTIKISFTMAPTRPPVK